MSDKPKKYFSAMREGVAEKLAQRQQELRKKSGLPHPDYYKELGKSYDIKDDSERMAHQSSLKKKYGVKEEVEMLDEMPESSMKTRDVHAHLKKSGWTLSRTGGGHDVYSHPKSKQHIAVPRHKQLKAPLIRGIMKASRVSEEIEIDEQLEKKGRFVSGPSKKTFKAPTIVSPIKEAKDPREYDYEGDMAMSQLRSLVFNAEDIMDLMDENTNLPEWVQSKITLAEDYISTAANYLRGELNEEVKNEYARKVDKYLKKKYDKNKQPQGADFAAQRRKERLAKNGRMDEDTLEEGIVGRAVGSAISKVINKLHSSNAKRPLPQASDRREYEKPKMEELELQEGRPSQRHPLEGHEYHKKSDEALIHIAKDAHAAAEAMKGHNTQAENKYRDQANDSATVRHFRKKSGMPDWYKKKYGHMNEDVKVGDKVSFDHPMSAVPGKTIKKVGTVHKVDGDTAHVKVKDKYGVMTHKKSASELRKEEIEYLEEKNVPTNPSLWSKAKSLARSKFDVYPSAYANGWAAKWYKSKGGGWKSVNEETSDEPSMAARTLSRKAQIVRDTAKNRKNEKDEASDKFQKDPELSSDIQKAP
jgi:predicted RNA binding protein YcfA (HicA-like mRNA interferase family)